MAAKQANQRRLVAQIAAASRWGTTGSTDARQELKALRAEEYIRHAVEAAPPLSAEQKLRLAALLTGRRKT